MNKITIVGRSSSDDLPEVSVGIDIQMHFSDDAPPALVQAIGRSIAELMTAWGKSDELEQIAKECEEITARRQRQADHATRMLLGDEEPNNEPL